MKKITCLLAAICSLSFALAQLENSKWKTTLHLDGSTPNVILYFKKDSVSLFNVPDSALIEKMTYTKNDTSFILTKIDGQSDCDNGSPGKYGFTIRGDSLFLTLLQDDCYDRYSVIQNTKWAKWKEYRAVKVDETTLKKYTGVYQHDEGHPIIISLENGVLYATGPNNNLPKSPFIPVTTSKFFLRIAAVEMDFISNSAGNVISLISHETKDFELKKIK
ncbi:MAG: DUF3471 domain-containing protein [Bacteroidota bacterium]